MSESMSSAVIQRLQAVESGLAKLQGGKTSSTTAAKSSTGNIVFIDPVSMGSGSTATGFTSANAANYLPGAVTGLYITCRLKTPALLADTTYTIDVRKDASDSTRNILTVYGIIGVAPDAGGGSSTALVPVTTGGTFQFQVTTTGANPASYDLKLEGYIA
jgi:hypothetical protein